MDCVFNMNHANTLAWEHKYDELHAYAKSYAEKGNADAATALGVCYFFGYGVDANREKAVCWYKRSAELGSIYGQFHYGHYIYHNSEDDSGKQRGLKELLKAAEQSYPPAQFVLGDIYEWDYCDVDNAIKYYEPAAESGYILAQRCLGMLLYKLQTIKRHGSCYTLAKEDVEKISVSQTCRKVSLHKLETTTETWLTHAAERGEWIAQIVLYDHLERADWREYMARKDAPYADTSMQTTWGERRWANGANPNDAIHNLEFISCLNWDKKRPTMNQEEAVWHVADACFWMGNNIGLFLADPSTHIKGKEQCFWFSRFLQIDPKIDPEAEDFRRKHALCRNAMIYYNGLGVPSNYKKAFECYSKALEDMPNDPGILLSIGACFFDGHGTNKDITTAAEYYAKAETVAVDSKDTDSLISLAIRYYYGRGANVDYAKALSLFEKAKALEEAEEEKDYKQLCHVKYYLGLCYYYGIGVERDVYKAVALFEEAINIKNKDTLTNFRTHSVWRAIRKGVSLEEEYDHETISGEACFFLGAMYEKGVYPVEQNIEKAYELFQRKLIYPHTELSKGVKMGGVVDLLSIRDSFFERPENIQRTIIVDAALRKLDQKFTTLQKVSNNLNQIDSIVASLTDKLQTVVKGLKEVGHKETDVPVRTRFEEAWSRDVLIAEMSDTISNAVPSTHSRLADAQAAMEELFNGFWQELHPATQQSLKTSHLFYSLLNDEKFEDLDYSGVCITMFSALENELKLRLVDGYKRYLEDHIGPKAPKTFPSNWPKFMRGSFVNKDQPEKGCKIRNTLTLGNVRFFLESHDTAEERKHMEGYLKSILREQDGVTLTSITDHLSPDTYTYSLLGLRNGAAHSGNISCEDASRCKPIRGTQNEGNQAKRTVIGLIYELISLTTIPKIK